MTKTQPGAEPPTWRQLIDDRGGPAMIDPAR